MPDAAPGSRRAPRGLARRNLDFPFETADIPRAWLEDDLFLSLFMDALSLVFPDGERFFVEAVKRAAAKVDDPALKADAADFAAQEGIHGREHLAFNALLRARLDREAVTRSEAEVRAILEFVRRTLPARGRLAVTCALEHFTAMLAEQVMEDERFQQAMDPSVRSLWLWHALEESEHKSVAFDLYEATGGGYARRVGIMALTTVVFIAEIANIHVRLLRAEELLWSPRAWLRGLNYMWRDPGPFRALIPRYLDYYRPSFHPDERDARALHEKTREALFGEGGAVVAFVKAERAKAA